MDYKSTKLRGLNLIAAVKLLERLDGHDADSITISTPAASRQYTGQPDSWPTKLRIKKHTGSGNTIVLDSDRRISKEPRKKA